MKGAEDADKGGQGEGDVRLLKLPVDVVKSSYENQLAAVLVGRGAQVLGTCAILRALVAGFPSRLLNRTSYAQHACKCAHALMCPG